MGLELERVMWAGEINGNYTNGRVYEGSGMLGRPPSPPQFYIAETLLRTGMGM